MDETVLEHRKQVDEDMLILEDVSAELGELKYRLGEAEIQLRNVKQEAARELLGTTSESGKPHSWTSAVEAARLSKKVQEQELENLKLVQQILRMETRVFVWRYRIQMGVADHFGLQPGLRPDA